MSLPEKKLSKLTEMDAKSIKARLRAYYGAKSGAKMNEEALAEAVFITMP